MPRPLTAAHVILLASAAIGPAIAATNVECEGMWPVYSTISVDIESFGPDRSHTSAKPGLSDGAGRTGLLCEEEAQIYPCCAKMQNMPRRSDLQASYKNIGSYA